MLCEQNFFSVTFDGKKYGFPCIIRSSKEPLSSSVALFLFLFVSLFARAKPVSNEEVCTMFRFETETKISGSALFYRRRDCTRKKNTAIPTVKMIVKVSGHWDVCQATKRMIDSTYLLRSKLQVEILNLFRKS